MDYFDNIYKGAVGFGILSMAAVGSTGLEGKILNIDLVNFSAGVGSLIGATVGFCEAYYHNNPGSG